MTLPPSTRAAVTQIIGRFDVLGSPGGGGIQSALHVASNERQAFLKYGRGTADGFFAMEAAGLESLAAATTTLRVPAVLGYHDAESPSDTGWLLLEWIERGRPGPRFAERLAQGLAELHAPVSGGWGWERDGYIGSLPQANGHVAEWPGFWREHRLMPQLDRARRSGMLPASEQEWTELVEALPALLAAGDADGPSLLHGDLWNGNILAAESGDPAIIDPAPYRGHREVDLAMLDLFGSPARGLDDLYAELRPPRSGFRERRGVYQLYYLLVHVNLFGHGYISRTAATLRSVLRSV